MKKPQPLPPPPILATEPGSWTLIDGELIPTPEPDGTSPAAPGALLVVASDPPNVPSDLPDL